MNQMLEWLELGPEEIVSQTAQHLAEQASPESILLSRILKLDSGALGTLVPSEDQASTAHVFNNRWSYAYEDLGSREPHRSSLELITRTIAVRGLTCIIVAQLSHKLTDGEYSGRLTYGSTLPTDYDDVLISDSGAVGLDCAARIVAGAEMGRDA